MFCNCVPAASVFLRFYDYFFNLWYQGKGPVAGLCFGTIFLDQCIFPFYKGLYHYMADRDRFLFKVYGCPFQPCDFTPS